MNMAQNFGLIRGEGENMKKILEKAGHPALLEKTKADSRVQNFTNLKLKWSFLIPPSPLTLNLFPYLLS